MTEQQLIHVTNKTEKIKLVIWDLDNTIWNGVLLEDSQVTLKAGISKIIHKLDERGILQSISSKNDFESAMEKLREFGLQHFFIYPRINWNSKSSSIKEIISLINIGANTVCFIDDQTFELEQVSSELPELLCIDAAHYLDIPDMEIMNPRFVTEDSKIRRIMYQNDELRNKAEEQFIGPKEEFLASLHMVFTISTVQPDDLKRVEELTVRTHQLNTTGYTYTYEQLEFLSQSHDHELLITSLTDKYGDYGKIGLVLLEKNEECWNIKLFLMSCRVMSRGVGTVLLSYILKKAQAAEVKLCAEFRNNDRNRMMYLTYRFAGFQEKEKCDDIFILEHHLNDIQKLPSYITLNVCNS